MCSSQPARRSWTRCASTTWSMNTTSWCIRSCWAAARGCSRTTPPAQSWSSPTAARSDPTYCFDLPPGEQERGRHPGELAGADRGTYVSGSQRGREPLTSAEPESEHAKRSVRHKDLFPERPMVIRLLLADCPDRLREHLMKRRSQRDRDGYRGISATPCATAHGAHSGISTSPSRSVVSRRVITADLSHIPTSSGCDRAQEHSQSRRAQRRVMRQRSSTVRTAGSLASLRNASLVSADVRCAHSATTAAVASQAATNCRTGSFSSLTVISSHPRADFDQRSENPWQAVLSGIACRAEYETGAHGGG